jgi:hypothetical protein
LFNCHYTGTHIQNSTGSYRVWPILHIPK